MIIKKLEVKGAGKKSAIVEFKAGLNVIAGASDTGKSYITKCFQFIFGAEQPPKAIDQAKGYTHLEVTFESSDGSSFVLSRELKEKADVTCTEIDKGGLVTILKPNHTGNPNLSNYFLSQIGLGNKILAKGVDSMNHSSLTLRILEKTFLIDEERIISENSPFGKGQNNEKTLETSLIKTLLTGEDDASICDSKDSKESKESMKRKIENLQDFLQRFFSRSDDDSSSLEQLDSILEGLEVAYDRAEEELNDLIRSSNAIVKEREKLKLEASVVSSNVADDRVLLGRFNLLDKKYLSDRERLEANTEAAVYIEQQKLVSCPICGSDIVEEDDELKVESIVEANAAEIRKIDIHLNDLRSTLADIQASLLKNEKKFESTVEEISKYDSILGSEIGGKLNENRRILKELDAARGNFRKEREQEKKRQEIFEEIGRLQTEHDEISDSYQISDFSREALGLGKKISEVLERWDFPGGKNAVFDVASRDIVIDGKPRSHYGKGYRAICCSSILLGLMEYLYPLGRHTGFVILDSPLTTYKKQDESLESQNEEVFLANNLIYAFYRDLCDFYSDKQIIVLDNQEPDEDLYAAMNYIHFSGNVNVGRYGFFPIQDK